MRGMKNALIGAFQGLGLRRFRVIRFLASRRIPAYTTAFGKRLFFDRYDNVLPYEILHGYETGSLNVVQKLVRSGDVVVDAGANIGYFTLVFSTLVGNGAVHSVEPSPVSSAVLKKNVSFNKLSNVTVHQCALTEKEGEVTLYLNDFNHADNRLYGKEGMKGVVVPAHPLDSFPELQTRVDFIKMDIQGSECLALRGAKNIIAKNPSIKMMLEFWPRGLANMGGSAEQLFDILRGFQLYRIDDEIGTLVRTTETELNGAYTRENGLYTNILATRTPVDFAQ